MKKYLIALLGILLISFVSAFPTINDVTIGETVISEDVVICADITDSTSDIIIVRVNLRSEDPLWNWGLIMYEEGENYCRTLSPEFMDAYLGKEITYYISARNLLSELTVSPTYHFTYVELIDEPEEPEPEPEEEEDESHSHTSNIKHFCEVSWKCGGWNSCDNGIMKRECYDANHCDYSYNQPNEIASCVITEKALVEGGNYNQIIVFLVLFTIILSIVLLAILIKR